MSLFHAALIMCWELPTTDFQHSKAFTAVMPEAILSIGRSSLGTPNGHALRYNEGGQP